jgi:hypothetical protein
MINSMFFDILTTGMFVVFNENSGSIVQYFLIAKCLMMVIISTLIPMREIRRGDVIIPIPPYTEAIETIDMVF